MKSALAKQKQTFQNNTYLNEDILSICCELLSQRDIVSMMQTCKFWNQVLTPKLYQRIIINGSPCQDLRRLEFPQLKDGRKLSKLQFDNANDCKFDNWMNFKIPINNLIKLYQSLLENPILCSYIQEIEIFDCYKTELRFYILQILDKILKQEPSSNFQNFKCHHTTSNQFYYQCLCYQEFCGRLLEYSQVSTRVLQNLCLNFNDFVRQFLIGGDFKFDKFDNFEIIINSYELNNNKIHNDFGIISRENIRNFYHRISKLTINDNFEYFCSFILTNTADESLHFENLKELNVTINFITDEVLKFFAKLKKHKLSKLSLIMYDRNEDEAMGRKDEDEEDLIPEKLFKILTKFDLTKLSIKLDNRDALVPFVVNSFDQLTHLCILNRFNNQDLSNFQKLKTDLPDLQYLNYSFQLNSAWLDEQISSAHLATLTKRDGNCEVCEQYHGAFKHNEKDRKKLTNIFVDDILPLISPKHDYRYLDQDLNLNEYPIGKITVDIIEKIQKDYRVDLDLMKCQLILNYTVHILASKINSDSTSAGADLKYLTIGGLPFVKVGDRFRCLIVA